MFVLYLVIMINKACFFIGSRHTPNSIKQQLTEIIEKHITEYGVTTFTVGHYGAFDNLVQEVLQEKRTNILILNYIYLRHTHWTKK